MPQNYRRISLRGTGLVFDHARNRKSLFINPFVINLNQMTMKKIAYFLSFMFLFTSVAPAAMAKTEKKIKPELTAEQQLRLEEIQTRLAEIKSMDFGEMSKNELKEVKVELKELKKEAKQNGGGIYLSVGAIIIILLVLILIT
jgi:hypothetical protein